MIGDTSFFNVFEEESALLYFERSSLTRSDIEEMPPFERQMTLEMFKKFNEEIKQAMDKETNKHKGMEHSAWQSKGKVRVQ